MLHDPKTVIGSDFDQETAEKIAPQFIARLQSGLSSRAKHGGTVFSAISGSIKDLTTVPGSYNHLGP